MTRIAVFASGAGTNAANIINYFRHHETIAISLVVCNRPGAGVVEIARSNNLPVLLIEKDKFYATPDYLGELRSHDIKFLVLAGFLWKIPSYLVAAYPGAIINIHPALLPLHGGKGMFGSKVHESVLAAGQNESGITIHFVDEHYDSGDIIFQQRCAVLPDDTPETLASRIHQLEYTHFPKVIEQVVSLMKNQ